MNPALAARCFLLISFAGKMTNFSYSGFDGVSGAIIISNILVPLIEKVTLPKAFGKEGK